MEAATAFLLASLTGGNAPASVQTDTTNIVASNPITAAAITKAYSMAPGTPQAGQVYVLEADFTATWESNAMAFQVGIGSPAAWTQMSPAVAAGAFSGGAVLAGWLRLTIRVLSATQARFALAGAVSETVTSVSPGSGSAPLSPLSQTLTVAAGDAIGLGVLFGASSGPQGLGTYGSTWLAIGAQG